LSEESLDITEDKIPFGLARCPSSLHKNHILELMTTLSHFHMQLSTSQ